MNQQIKLAVFDLAGTTVKDDNAVRDCLYKAAVQYDLKATPDEIANLMGTNKIHLYQFLIAKNQGRIMDFRGFEEDIFEDTYELAKKIYDCYVEIMIDYYRSPMLFKSAALGNEVSQREMDDYTGMIRELRNYAETAGRKRGRPIYFAFRLPDSPIACRAIGVDVERWAREGLFDILKK